MNRKRYIVLCFLCLHLFLVCAQNHAERVNIWQGTAVKKTVSLTPYLANGENNVAVIVCPVGVTSGRHEG